MIRLSLGNVGSGKTVSEVRSILLNESGRTIYSNINTTGIKHNKTIGANMIIKREIVGYKNKRDGTKEPITKLELNKEFWQNIKEPINFVFDEAHTILNPRRAMSKTNIIMTDFLALIRRVLGSNDAGEGEAVFITQLPRRLDPITREMATEIKFHVCHYRKNCKQCGFTWGEHSEVAERIWICPRCGVNKIFKSNHIVEVWHFANMESFYTWREAGRKTFYKHYFITDIEKYFSFYDTLQWDNMLSEFY